MGPRDTPQCEKSCLDWDSDQIISARLITTQLQIASGSGRVGVRERGRFVWPQAASGTVSLTRAQLSMLQEGIDWRRPERTWEPQLSV
jgi:transposase